MQLYFVGNSFAPQHLKQAAMKRGFDIASRIKEAQLVFISQDTEVEPEYGNRILQPIKDLIADTREKTKALLVLSSQVPPGFTRALRMEIYHMAETLRIKDAAERAYAPEQIIIGCEDRSEPLPTLLLNYCQAFHCPINQVSYETAEYAKICINMTLAAEVDNANRLYEGSKRIKNCDWGQIQNILRHDKRIGSHHYLDPGDWRKSKHLLRDAQTLADLVPEGISRKAGKIQIPQFRWGSSRLG